LPARDAESILRTRILARSYNWEHDVVEGEPDVIFRREAGGVDQPHASGRLVELPFDHIHRETALRL
jgi:hypothetical protein